MNLEVSNARELQNLSEVTTFEQRDHSVFVNNIKWHHTKPQLLMTDPVFLTVWSFSESAAEVVGSVDLGSRLPANKGDWVAAGACWDPHSMASCATTSGCDLKIIDTRSFDISLEILGMNI
jgi:hypothetical protein